MLFRLNAQPTIQHFSVTLAVARTGVSEQQLTSRHRAPNTWETLNKHQSKQIYGKKWDEHLTVNWGVGTLYLK